MGFWHDARRVVTSICCSAGGIVGLWQGMLSAPIDPGSAQLLPALAEMMKPIALHVVAGVVTGALVAHVLCALTPGLRRRV